jgi:UDP-N-acetylmuramoylalanine-D-glutamate ligase
MMPLEWQRLTEKGDTVLLSPVPGFDLFENYEDRESI